MRKAGGKRFWSLERDPVFGAVIIALVSLAGLSDVVKVEIGSSDASIKRLHDSGALKHIDLMFLDHYKPAYKTDLKLCEELKLVTPGSVLAADNVIKPGNPPYLEYVRSNVAEKREAITKSNGESGPDARFADKTAGQYAKRQGQEQLHLSQGNPNLIYKSELVNSFEPTGVPVSRICRMWVVEDKAADVRERMALRSHVASARNHKHRGGGRFCGGSMDGSRRAVRPRSTRRARAT